MAHEFKRLGDVEIAEAISESANVLIEEEGNIKRVSKNNVVPNNVALKSDIPDAVINPSSAVVGQTIVVKAVDENGKPIEWECADMSSGCNDNNYYIVTDRSSMNPNFVTEGLYEAIQNLFETFIPLDITIWMYESERWYRNDINGGFWQNGENFEAYVGSNQSYHLIVYPNHTVELFYDN